MAARKAPSENARIPAPTEAARWRRRKDARPQEILEAALSVFAEKGFAAARMEQIAARAGVSKGTIYLYFDSKEAVFRALVHEMLGTQLARFADSARASSGPVAPVIADILRMIGEFVATSNRVVLPKIVIAEAGNFPDLARIYREEVIERGLGLFAGLLKKGMASGELRSLPLPHAVRLCIAPVLLAAMWRTTFAQLDSEPYDYPGLIEAHIATLLRGLQRGESDA
ncbi:MAG TPA: TetR/AcrR family transcriptional regulator [Micropepsaceae bacterium]|jgi:AcrR family transcriptional regulator|nr:TetR/AcrR family transcriptional regulator [Micropepsaceae bacterium]